MAKNAPKINRFFASFNEKTSLKCPIVFKFLNEICFNRFSTESDSGRKVRIDIAEIKNNPAVTKNGNEIETEPNQPPNAGPTINPVPIAPPIYPNHLVRSSGFVTSDIYAKRVLVFPAVSPSIIRPRNRIHNDPQIPNRRYPATEPMRLMNKIIFRP